MKNDKKNKAITLVEALLFNQGHVNLKFAVNH
jgi:hypothetical protein